MPRQSGSATSACSSPASSAPPWSSPWRGAPAWRGRPRRSPPLLFALSPLAVEYGRWTYIDNLVTPWILASVVLALSPRRSIAAGAGAGLCFAVAALTKETALVLLPVPAWAMWRNSDPRNRRQVLTVATGATVLVMALYPLYAALKGELVPGPGHNSLLGTAQWQLAGRASSGSLLDPASPVRHLLAEWLDLDRILLLGGLVGSPVALSRPRLRPVVLAVAIGWLLLVRGGYVPYMQVLAVLPWSAVVIAGAGEVLACRIGPRVPRDAAAAGLVAALGFLAWSAWPQQLRPLMTTRTVQPMRAAEMWTADNVPRDRVLVVHDSIWVDLVAKYGFQPRPVMVSKLDADPSVRQHLTRVDYLVVPNW